MIHYAQIPAGLGVSTLLPGMDFESYSEAGYVLYADGKKWVGIKGCDTRSLKAVGASVYSEHPSTEVTCLAYDLRDGRGTRLWRKGDLPPYDLFEYLARGGLISAWNSSFEYYMWTNVCVKKLGWPPLNLMQLRCSMSKSRYFALPGKLEKAAEVLGAPVQKDKRGKNLINRLSVPKNYSIKEPYLRRTTETHPEEFNEFYVYCVGDVDSEGGTSALIPDLSPEELKVFQLDQKINFRGVYIDRTALDNCIAVVDLAFARYTQELQTITGGFVKTIGQVKKIRAWMELQGFMIPSLKEESVTDALARTDVPPLCRRVLELRQLIGSASVKKLYTIERRLSNDGRLKDLFIYCGASRTSRWAGSSVQPHNLPNSGPHPNWNVYAVETALSVMATRDIDTVEAFYKDAISAISGCLRGLFCAPPGKELICSDYSAIEAVIIAELSRQEWRQEVFRTHRKLYEKSAAEITGIPFEEFLSHKGETGDHHPMRKLGKVAELAGGYQGSLGAWKAFGAGKFMNDEEILLKVAAWRAASPKIVALWYGLQDAAMAAIRHPGKCFGYNGISYGLKGNILYCRLLSGRTLQYHSARIEPKLMPWGKMANIIKYWGWNSDSLKGPIGWMDMDTYGGKLTENVVQATARDILAHAMVNLDEKYPLVLHVHDEPVSEVIEGYGSIEEYEQIMEVMPAWATGWPIKASGGWRGKRYRKD